MKTRQKSRLHRQVTMDSPPTTSPDSEASPSTSHEPPVETPAAAAAAAAAAVAASTSPIPISASASTESSAPTPSYPFPHMAQRFSTSTMSPNNISPHDRTLPSGTNTPASVAFNPPGTKPGSSYENPDFPSPNLYELALLLHSEPGMD